MITQNDYELILSNATRADDYVNATALCKQFGKRVGDWKDLPQTKALIKVAATKYSGSCIEVVRGKSTHVCPELAIALAEWLSPEFHLYVLQVFQAYVTADLSLATDIVRRSKDREGLKQHSQEVQTHRLYLDSYHGVHDQLKEHGCSHPHHAAYNRDVNKAVGVEKGQRELMAETDRLAMHLMQVAGDLRLRNSEAQGWSAKKEAVNAGLNALESVLTNKSRD